MKKLKKLTLFFAMLLLAILVLPSKANATEMSANFQSGLTNGKFVINSVKPESAREAYTLIQEPLSEKGYYVDIDSFDSDFTKANVIYHFHQPDEEIHEVDFTYNYDPEIKQVIDDYVSKIPEEKINFEVRDMELANYWVNGCNNFTNYSSEFKQYIDYKNFTIDVRMGESAPFRTGRGGIGTFNYEGTIYHIYQQMVFTGNHIIYVPSSTGDTQEELRAAAQKRFDDYLGKDKITVTNGDKNVYDYFVDDYDAQIEEFTQKLNEENAKPTPNMMNVMNYQNEIDNNTMYKENFIDSYNDPEGDDHFLKTCAGNYFFIAHIGENEQNFVVVKDDSKMLAPTYKNADAGSNVSVTTSGKIPLDTLIKVRKLTSGEEYEKIIKILKTTNNEMFDLKLYSNSLEEYITKLDDGSFQVKLPIPEKLKGKDLAVYYVDENDKKIEYPVTPDGDYAIFNTNHFSIYTLADKNNTTDTSEKDETPKTGCADILICIKVFLVTTGITLAIKTTKSNE